MNLSQLRIFKVVAELQNISKASEALYIAQPSISRTISSLEKELNVALFERRGRNIYLNNNGMILLKYTNEILSSFDRLKFELNEASFDSLSEMPINFYAASRVIPHLARELHKQYPNIKFQLYRQPANQFEQGNRGRMAIYADTKESSSENTTLLLKEKIMAVIPTSNPLSKKKSISLSDLKNQKLLCATKDISIRMNMDYYFKRADIKPDISIECADPSAVLDLILSGIEISFVPQYSWGKISLPDNLVMRNISEPECVRYLYLTWGHGKREKPSNVSRMESILIDFFDEIKSHNNDLYD